MLYYYAQYDNSLTVTAVYSVSAVNSNTLYSSFTSGLSGSTNIPYHGVDFLTYGLGLTGGKWVQCQGPNAPGGTFTHTDLPKNYPAIGYKYDPTRNAFIAPKRYPSWVWNEELCRYVAPVALPNSKKPDNSTWGWDETTKKWV